MSRGKKICRVVQVPGSAGKTHLFQSGPVAGSLKKMCRTPVAMSETGSLMK